MTKFKIKLGLYASDLYVRLGGAVARVLDLRLEIAGSIPAAALLGATLDRSFTHSCLCHKQCTLHKLVSKQAPLATQVAA